MRQDRRRRFLLALGALLAAPAGLFAQQSDKVRRIGFLSPDPADTAYSKYVQPIFSDSLRRLGYAVGRDLLIEWRWGDGKESSLPPLAEELVKLKVELIVARSGAIPAAMAATRSIPIVMLNRNFPVEVGWIKSLAKPGGNVTGTTFIAPETIEKNLQLLKEFVPRVTRAGIFMSDSGMNGEWGRIYLGSVQRAAVRVGMTVEQAENAQAATRMTLAMTRPASLPPVPAHRRRAAKASTEMAARSAGNGRPSKSGRPRISQRQSPMMMN
jgi:putative ABC transport system substrate-binding protein